MIEDLALVFMAAAVGALVGLTGVGGGAVMTPALILLFGVSPVTAVATDLVFALVTKIVSGVIHNKAGVVDWTALKKMWLGSLPGVALGVFAVVFLFVENLTALTVLLTLLLIFTALSMLKPKPHIQANRMSKAGTAAGGLFIGFSVATTSVGAGALGMVLLRSLLGDEDSRRLVGTDVVHAIPLALLAGLSYGFAGLIDWNLLLILLTGSVPGVIFGSLLVRKINTEILRRIVGLVLILAAAGIGAKAFGLA